MKIVADENIPYVTDAFRTLGEVTTVKGRNISPEAVRDADVLLVRSVTKVNRQLLAGSRVKFVATATIGFDHIDPDYLREAGIAFAAAPGSNADSVSEYVVAALLVLARRKDFTIAGLTIGVIGVGNVGSRVAKKAEALGMKVLLNDPPLRRRTGDKKFLPLERLFEADVITLHVPLERAGEDKTYHLAGEEFFRRMKPGGIFFNTSRGAVTDEKALLGALAEGRIAAAVLDVWENEPVVNVELLGRTALATPHIAGYSFDGKVNGTLMIYRAACRFLGAEPVWEPGGLLPAPPVPLLELDETGKSDEEILDRAVRGVYDIERDDQNLRRLTELVPERRGSFFDDLRKNYPVRREFFNTEIRLVTGNENARRKLTGIGFKVNDGR